MAAIPVQEFTNAGLFTKGVQQAINGTGVENGKIRVSTNSNRLFFDLDNRRIEITDFVWTYTQEELIAGEDSQGDPIPSVLNNKLFIASDTRHLFVYNENLGTLVDLTSFKVDNATNADTASTATYAVNASTAAFVETASTAEYATNASTADYVETASTANYATNASTADYAETASTANYANSAGSASSATSATNASTAEYAVSAGSATSATSATNASTAVYAGTAGSATSATNASTAAYASQAAQDASGNTLTSHYAPIDSPAFAGTATAPTQAITDDSAKIATTAFVQAVVADALAHAGGGLSIEIVETLPETGSAGTFYFVPNGESTGANRYDEYVWLETLNRYEYIGTATIDLSNYLNGVSEDGTGNAFTSFTKSGNSLTLHKDSTFLTAHPGITQGTNTTSAESPAAGSTFTVIDTVTKDANGHVTAYNTKIITLPETASTANYAESAASATSATNASTADYAANAANATNASTANYATSAGSANSATNASTAVYAESAGSVDSASSANYAATAGYLSGAVGSATSASYITTGSTQNRIPYYGNGGTTGSAASTATADTFVFDFGDIDSNAYYY